MAFAEAAANLVPAGPSLDSVADRIRLTAPGLRTFFNIADDWGLTTDQQRTLLGGISKSSLHNWKAGHASALSRDQLERVSLVLGIYKGMALLFADGDGAKRWLNAANTEAVFDGSSPLSRMLRGGIEDLYVTRRYIDAWRGVR
jgi:antitoxin Xre/MbcA/ParS-like protein